MRRGECVRWGVSVARGVAAAGGYMARTGRWMSSGGARAAAEAGEGVEKRVEEEIRRVRAGLFHRTPVLRSAALSARVGCEVFTKMEFLQPSGSFKDRGLSLFCATKVVTEGVGTFVSSSGGNAGLSVAVIAQKLGVPCEVVCPTTTSDMMIDLIKAAGAHVTVYGDNWNGADELAREMAREPRALYVHPFEDEIVHRGHADIVREIAEDGLRPNAMVAAVGGGGLVAGVYAGLGQQGWSDVTVVTGETEGAASFAGSVEQDELITLDKIDTLAGTLGARQVTPHALDGARRWATRPCVVSDGQAVHAVEQFARDHRVLVEPSCGASLALMYQDSFRGMWKEITGGDPNYVVVAIVCGGNAISVDMLGQYQEMLR